MRDLLTAKSRVHHAPAGCARALVAHLLFPPPALHFSLTPAQLRRAASLNHHFLTLRPWQATARVLQLSLTLGREPHVAIDLLHHAPRLWTSSLETAALKVHYVREWSRGGHVDLGWLTTAGPGQLARCVFKVGTPTLARLAYLQQMHGDGDGAVIDVEVGSAVVDDAADCRSHASNASNPAPRARVPTAG